jgi:hypothetical protein
VVAVARRREGDEGSASDCRPAVDRTKFTKCCESMCRSCNASCASHMHTVKRRAVVWANILQSIRGGLEQGCVCSAVHACSRQKQAASSSQARQSPQTPFQCAIAKNSCDGEGWLRKVRVPRDTQAVSHHGQIRNKAHCAPTIFTQQPGRSRHPCLQPCRRPCSHSVALKKRETVTQHAEQNRTEQFLGAIPVSINLAPDPAAHEADAPGPQTPMSLSRLT